ncbi:hypothetical protein PFISCL1PPCAC_28221, partial [Pristionchus fissidentatus]
HPNGDLNRSRMAAIALTNVSTASTLGVSALCAYRTMSYFQSKSMSLKRRKIQLQLFRSLLAQFLVPFVMSTVPMLIIGTLPVTGIRFGETVNILGILGALFPAIDSFTVIFMVSR